MPESSLQPSIRSADAITAQYLTLKPGFGVQDPGAGKDSWLKETGA
jgi:hypothetical protein